MADVAVLGAGPAGLACAYHLLQQGHRATIYEADDRPGGMSAHFDFDGLDLERFYHFVCKPDQPLLDLLEELGLADRLEWVRGSMGYFYEDELFEWGHPIALWKFPHLSLLSKLRYALHTFLSIRLSSWPGLEHQNAVDWVKRWVGQQAYDVLWRPLFDLKFFEYCDDLSADWIRARVRRLGRSRQSIFHEELGFLRGGSKTLVGKLASEVERLGGSILLECPATRVEIGPRGVSGVVSKRGTRRYDYVATTMPIPYVPRVIPDLPSSLKERYARLANIGVVCVLFKLRRPVTRFFWLNTNARGMEIPGIIEYSNLQRIADAIVYVPYYLPQGHPRFQQTDDEFVAQSFGYLQRINPELGEQDVKATKVSRIRYAQPICPRGFRAMLPPIETEVRGLYIADTSYYYPEDRSMSESVRLGRTLCDAIVRHAHRHPGDPG